ncbi:hypothetical protein CYMTET_19610 [Cymbomonas tetramitiformis]|uniref:Uncharacterized protein n=1 Tax=Cymbomonas tetramitiformis TaxID=36881 RepID=A0AAE0G681_9CHLO|nr:hypothetical protein CYMTET_19610 [Cymbomonas tetramitiformis]
MGKPACDMVDELFGRGYMDSAGTGVTAANRHNRFVWDRTNSPKFGQWWIKALKDHSRERYIGKHGEMYSKEALAQNEHEEIGRVTNAQTINFSLLDVKDVISAAHSRCEGMDDGDARSEAARQLLREFFHLENFVNKLIDRKTNMAQSLHKQACQRLLDEVLLPWFTYLLSLQDLQQVGKDQAEKLHECLKSTVIRNISSLKQRTKDVFQLSAVGGDTDIFTSLMDLQAALTKDFVEDLCKRDFEKHLDLLIKYDDNKKTYKEYKRSGNTSLGKSLRDTKLHHFIVKLALYEMQNNFIPSLFGKAHEEGGFLNQVRAKVLQVQSDICRYFDGCISEQYEVELDSSLSVVLEIMLLREQKMVIRDFDRIIGAFDKDMTALMERTLPYILKEQIIPKVVREPYQEWGSPGQPNRDRMAKLQVYKKVHSEMIATDMFRVFKTEFNKNSGQLVKVQKACRRAISTATGRLSSVSKNDLKNLEDVDIFYHSQLALSAIGQFITAMSSNPSQYAVDDSHISEAMKCSQINVEEVRANRQQRLRQAHSEPEHVPESSSDEVDDTEDIASEENPAVVTAVVESDHITSAQGSRPKRNMKATRYDLAEFVEPTATMTRPKKRRKKNQSKQPRAVYYLPGFPEEGEEYKVPKDIKDILTEEYTNSPHFVEVVHLTLFHNSALHRNTWIPLLRKCIQSIALQ